MLKLKSNQIVSHKYIPKFLALLEPQMKKWKEIFEQLKNDKENVELLVEYF